MFADSKSIEEARTRGRTRGGADEAEGRARDNAEQAESRASERAEQAEARAIENAEQAESRGREKAEQAEAHAAERAGRAIERAERVGGGRAGPEHDEAASIWHRAEPSSRKPSHTRADIAAAALQIADAEGFDAVSMRRVAQQLGAGTMTLYHYVRNKDELVTLMFDAVMGELLLPAAELTGGWRHAVERIAVSSHEAFHRHGWALERLGDGRPGPNGLRHFEQSLAAIAELDLPPYEKFELIGQIDDYVFGYALREAEELIEHERGWSPQMLDFFQRELDSGEYPLISDFLGDEVGEGIQRVIDYVNRDGRFERGLERLLDGIEAHVAPRGTENSSS